MNRKIKQLSILVGLLAILLGGCDVEPITAGAAGASAAELPNGVQLEVQPTPEGQADAGGITVETSTGSVGAPKMGEPINEVSPDDMPSLEEREAMLDRVNLPGLVFPEDQQAPVGEGPDPGTESILGPGAGLDDILDDVNKGGPVLTGGDSTESVVAESPSPSLLSRFMTTLSNWLRAVLN